MIYQIEFKPRALKDQGAIDHSEAHRLIAKIEALKNDLSGDVKRLTQFTPESSGWLLQGLVRTRRSGKWKSIG